MFQRNARSPTLATAGLTAVGSSAAWNARPSMPRRALGTAVRLLDAKLPQPDRFLIQTAAMSRYTAFAFSRSRNLR